MNLKYRQDVMKFTELASHAAQLRARAVESVRMAMELDATFFGSKEATAAVYNIATLAYLFNAVMYQDEALELISKMPDSPANMDKLLIDLIYF